MANVVNWFEIPVKNFDRACKFYSKVLDGDIQKMDSPTGLKMGFLPETAPIQSAVQLLQARVMNLQPREQWFI